MPIIIFNLEWMAYNSLLALLGVFFSLLLLRSKNLLIKILFFILWLLFVPNTIYMTTDLQHLPGQFMELELPFQIILIAQYLSLILLGILTFFLSLYIFEKSLFKLKFKDQRLRTIILFFLNYPLAFGVALGRFERVNSWSIITEPQEVLNSTLNLLQSPELLLIIFLFGSLMNLLYFFLKKITKL